MEVSLATRCKVYAFPMLETRENRIHSTPTPISSLEGGGEEEEMREGREKVREGRGTC